jgi:hypothetical protein
MLAADAELDILTRFAAALGREAHQFADAVAVDRHERIARQNALRGVDAEEARGIVAADAEGRLCQIVGAEGKELGRLCDLACLQRRARQLDHGADLIVDLRPCLSGDRLGHGVDPLLDQIELGLAGDQRHHDFRHHRLAAPARDLDSGLEDRARLHLGNFRIGDGEPATAEAEHRIELVQFARALGKPASVGAHGPRDFGDLALRLREKFMQWRIEKPDGHRQAVHDGEQFDEVGALHRQQLGQRRTSRFLVLGENHLAHRADAILLEEHMLGAAQPDALGAEFDGSLRVRRRVGVGAHFQLARGVGPPHQCAEFAGERRLAHRHLAGQHLPGRAVDGDDVAFLHRHAAG